MLAVILTNISGQYDLANQSLWFYIPKARNVNLSASTVKKIWTLSHRVEGIGVGIRAINGRVFFF